MMYTKKMLIPALLLGASALFGFSKDGEYAWRKIDDSHVTTHRKFASPIAGRKIKAMIFAHGIGQRELVEFKQRFEYQYFLFPIASNKSFSPYNNVLGEKVKPSTPYASAMSEKRYLSEVQKMLNKELPQCDAIVVCKFPFTKIPVNVKKELLRQVDNGKVLFLIADKLFPQSVPGMKFQPVKVDFPTDAIPMLKGTKISSAVRGKGKIVIIAYPGFKTAKPLNMIENLTPFESDDPLYYDYYFAFLGKCFRHFLRPEAKAIKAVSANGSITATKGVKIVCEVINKYGEVILKKEKARSVSTANTPFAHRFSLPRLSQDARMIDYRLYNQKGEVLDYNVVPLPISGSVKISLKKDGFKPDEPIPVVIDSGSGRLRVTLTDQAGNLLYQKTLNGGKKVAHTIRFPWNENKFAVLRAVLEQNGRKVDECREYVYFNTAKDISEFSFAIWSYASSRSRVSQLWHDQMAAYKVDNVMECNSPWDPAELQHYGARQIRRSGMNCSFHVSHLDGKFRSQRGYCSLDFWENLQKDPLHFMRKDAKPMARYPAVQNLVKSVRHLGAVFYNLGDENVLSFGAQKELCFCDNCQRRFRAYLKKEHKTIAELNKEYGSNYKSFDAIKAVPLEKAAEMGQYGLWMDFRLFMEDQFTNWHRYLIAVIKHHDPEARIGAEGMVYPADSKTGYNLYKLLKYFDFCAPYHVERDIRALQFMPKDGLKSSWFGTYAGDMARQNISSHPWRNLFAGLHGAFYWYAGSPVSSGAFSNALIYRPDLKMLSQFTVAADEINKIRDTGLGMTFIQSEQIPNGIYIHYSNQCLHAATLNPDRTSWQIAQDDFAALLEAMGINSRYLPVEILEKKGVPADAKVVILPYSQAMSLKEAAALRTFVKNGGMLIADYSPAIMSEHGRFLEKGRLADLFPVTDKMHMHKYGKGYTVLLYDYISGIGAKVNKNDANGILNGIGALFKKAGVKIFASAKDDNGYYKKVAIFGNGTTRYLGMLAQRSEEVKVKTGKAGAEAAALGSKSSVGGSFVRTIKLEKPMHVYDVLRRKYLGRTDKVTLTLEPAVGRVLTCTEKKLTAPVIRMQSSVARGQKADFRIGIPDNVVTVSIKAPSGKEVYVKRICKPGTGRFVPALNSERGTYTMTVQEVSSGLTALKKFNVK